MQTSKTVFRIPINDICYFEKLKNTHNICVVYNSGYAVFRGELKEIKAILEKMVLDGRFIYAHVAFIVNGKRLHTLSKGSDGRQLYFDNGQTCRYSNPHRKELERWIK